MTFDPIEERDATIAELRAEVAPLRDEVAEWRRVAGSNWEMANGEEEHAKAMAERADAAESALRQVREDLRETIKREGKLHSTWDRRSEMVVPVEALDAILDSARVGAADTQPEGAGEDPVKAEAKRRCAEYRRSLPANVSTEASWEDFMPGGFAGNAIATPTAGGKVDTAPEALCSNCGRPTTSDPCSQPDGKGGVVTGHWIAGGPSTITADTAPESGEGR